MAKKGKVVWVRDEIYDLAKEFVDKGYADSISGVFTDAILEFAKNKGFKVNLDSEMKEFKAKLKEVAKFLEELSERI